MNTNYEAVKCLIEILVKKAGYDVNKNYEVDRTPFIDEKRGEEIKTWIKTNGDVEDFVILDDVIFDSFDDLLLKKLIKISNGNGLNLGEGLSAKDVEDVIERLGRNKIKTFEEER